MMLYVRLLAGLAAYLGGLSALACAFGSPSWRALFLATTALLIPVLLLARRSTAHRRYLASSCAAYLRSPILFLQDLVYALGQILLLIADRSSRAGLDDLEQAVEYHLPFEGVWSVANGGPDRSQSHSWSIVSQRYAYDFNVIADEGTSYRHDGRELEDFLAYGRAILAPAPGVVVRARDGMRDYPKTGTGWIDWRAGDPRGNHVLIRHARGEYSVLAHLQPGSVRVRVGDEVRRGQPMGFCGNSGHSTQPHLHFHVQDRSSAMLARGRPVRLSGFSVIEADGRRPVARGYPRRGQRVQPDEAKAP
ncbi:MAG: M23 family metallopeptidase [bacterium]|nr:M23 family metallopeptidase [bacterium]